MIARLKACWAAAKVYAVVLTFLAMIVAGWWHGRQEFAAGKAAGDAEVAKVKAAYLAAADKADAYSRAQQQAADEARMAEAFRRRMQVERQLVQLTQRTDAAERSAKAFKDKYDALKKHDPAVRDWADTPIPDSVRAAGTGGSK